VEFINTAQSNSYSAAQLQFSQYANCATPITFSQKLYKYDDLAVANEYEQAIEENSLEKIKKLLDKLVRLG